jgi:hypothetical protein
MKACLRLTVVSLALFVWRGESQAGAVSGTVADYNVTSVRTTNGALTVPATLNFTYTATATIPTGTIFTVTLPTGFTFSSVPALTASNGTTTVSPTGAGGQGVGFQTATFTVGADPLLATQTITFGAFGILATPLKTITPLANALSLTMQAGGIDLSPLPLPAFASDPGITAIFVGAVQFIDINPPSNGTQFLSSPDTYTAVLNAFAVQPQTPPLLSAAGTALTVSPTDQATVTILGNFGGIGEAFASSTSNCLTPIATGTVNSGSISIPNVPLNHEEFGCVTGNGGVIQSNPNGFTTVTVSPGTSTDFASVNAVVEFAGEICYTAGSGCVAFTPPAPPAVGTPTLSGWAMYGLAGIMLLFGIRKLSTTPTI